MSTPGDTGASPAPAGGTHGPGSGASPAGRRFPERPPLVRRRDGRWLAGVCSGIAVHLGWPVWVVRLCVVCLAMADYLGVVLYAAMWVLLPDQPPEPEAPGLAAARHADMRRTPRRHRSTQTTVSVAAVVVLCVGLLLLGRAIGFGPGNGFFWPIALAAVGVALVWRQADGPDDAAQADTPRWIAPLVSNARWASVLRMAAGMSMVGAAVWLVAYNQVSGPNLPSVLAVAALTLVGFCVVAAPWINQMRTSLNQAREEKLLADARADMAAHLHDSVLQTLALIQRQADDPKAVSSLARRQERELRSWLYGEAAGPQTFHVALAAAGSEVEDERGVPVEVICIGDAPMSDGLEATIRAAREAMTNAVKHSGAPKVDVYAEVDDEHVEVFVRDRGVGFDLAGIGEDRMGVQRSIIERMERHGGTARVRTAPGEGTEVRLEMSR